MKKVLSSLGPVSAVIGAQWGDEGKGKIVDILAEHFDVIARATGGANAGHTIIVEGKKHVFHLLPSGSLHKGKEVVIGSGVVMHLPTLLEEIEILRAHDADFLARLRISTEAHVVLDAHKEIDGALEESRSKRIGTTKRGIGPAYMDKAMRTGIRMGDLAGDIGSLLREKSAAIKRMYGVEMNPAEEEKRLRDAMDIVGACVTDTVGLLHDALEAKKTILIEGAQGTLLDLDHGTYPYVTSSSTTTAGALQGLGIPPRALTSAIGVAKAYCTRVGEGDFPTEAQGEASQRLRERGGEYGATTGRPRRTGWLHMGDLRRAARLNGFTHWNITKLDVLDAEDEIPFAAADASDGAALARMPGWKSSTVGLQSYDELPKNARGLIERVEKETGVPVSFIGTGPERQQMITRLS